MLMGGVPEETVQPDREVQLNRNEYLLKRKPTNQPISDSGVLHPLQFCGNEGA